MIKLLKTGGEKLRINVSTVYGSKKITIEEEGKKVVIEPHYNQDNIVSVTELHLSRSDHPKKLLELFAEISSLDTYPEEPSFRIHYKDGRSVWISIGQEQIHVLYYLQGSSLPQTAVVPLPQSSQKTLEVFQKKD